MLHAYVQTFDVTENLKNFWEINMSLIFIRRHPQAIRRLFVLGIVGTYNLSQSQTQGRLTAPSIDVLLLRAGLPGSPIDQRYASVLCTFSRFLASVLSLYFFHPNFAWIN
jgi:hypothetical protein